MGHEIALNGTRIGTGQPVYLIAEIGGNFRDFPTATKLIDLASEAGANAVKLQHYRADTLTSRKALFEMENTGVVSQYDLFKQYELSEELTTQIFAYGRQKQMAIFSTPSHPSDVDLLEQFGVPAYKIGSDDAVNTPLLKHVARLGKPIILSTGMCTLREVEHAVDAIVQEGNDQIALLHCTTNYPTHPDSVNLRAMQALQARFDFPVGYSDHTLGIDTCYAAAVLGAAVLEFHFTFDKQADGPDHMLSKDFADTVALVKKVRQLPVLLGDGIKRPAASEMSTLRNNRKSLVLTHNVLAGEKITAANIAIKRPGYGISCANYYEVIGKTARRDLAADDVLRWDDIA